MDKNVIRQDVYRQQTWTVYYIKKLKRPNVAHAFVHCWSYGFRKDAKYVTKFAWC